MGVTLFRPGQRLIVPGVRVFQPGTAAASSWWLSGGISAANCVCAYAPKGAASLAASYTNLANPGTYNAAPGVAPTFASATGWTFNGAAQYLDTGIVPGISWSAIVRFSNVTNANVLFESFNGGSQRFCIWPNDGFVDIFYGNGGSLTKTPQLTSGVLAIAGSIAYRNGSAETGSISAGTAPTRTIFIAASNRGAGAVSLLAGNIQAFAIYNTTLTAGQVASLTTAMSNL